MSYKILLVDDAADLLNAYVRLLQISTSYEVRIAESGRSALNVIRAWRPDLIVTDIMMPDMNGLELISRIRSDLLPPLPIIAVWSGFPEFEAEARRRGAQFFQPKPLHPDNLVLFIESLLGERNAPERLQTDALERRRAASQLAQIQLSRTLSRRPYFQKTADLSSRLISRYFGDADVGLLVMEQGHMRLFAASDSPSASLRLEGIIRYAVNIVESGSTLILPDLSAILTDEPHAPAPDARLFVAVPARLDGVTIGALALADRLRFPFDVHDLAILEHIGDLYAAVLADEPSSRAPREPGVLINESWRYCLRHEIDHLCTGRTLIVALASLPTRGNPTIPVTTQEELEAVRRAVDRLIELLPPRAALGRLNPMTLGAYAMVEDPTAAEQRLPELMLSLADEPKKICVAALAVSGLRPVDGGAAVLEVAQCLLNASMAHGPGTTLHARVKPEITSL